MDISECNFHDGCIIAIEHKEKNIDFYLESAESWEDQESIALSEHGTVKGILHFVGVEEIREDLVSCKTVPFKFDYGNIYNLIIRGRRALVVFNGVYLKPNFLEIEYLHVEILAKEIVWENIPDLKNPHRP